MFRRVLIVCVGNICRSPTAEVLLRQQLHDLDVTVESAGLAAVKGHPIDATAQAVLNQHGMSGQSHVARQIDRAMIDAADLVLTMEPWHIDAVLRISPHARGKTYLLGKWLDNTAIPDPYRQSHSVFEQSYQLISSGVSSWRGYL
ncbi:Low molecular weight protein-tyrosine-phosphatase wzb [compost metagenome]|uniref:low molecular weight protein-tyrosine-phosphatase n=1 Tax=Lysobacter capsici TaxID=435897 RepID=UPI00055E1057|nr:low molecular weight protein-tyrosine-phosphatase [Lysobacter capsici]